MRSWRRNRGVSEAGMEGVSEAGMEGVYKNIAVLEGV